MLVCRPVRRAESGDGIIFKIRAREVTLTCLEFAHIQHSLSKSLQQLTPALSALNALELADLFSRSWDDYRKSLDEPFPESKTKPNTDWSQGMTFYVLYKPFGSLMRAAYDIDPEIVVALFAMIQDRALSITSSDKRPFHPSAHRKKALLKLTLMSCDQKPTHACCISIHASRHDSRKVVFDRFLVRCGQLLRLACKRIVGFTQCVRELFDIDVEQAIDALEEDVTVSSTLDLTDSRSSISSDSSSSSQEDTEVDDHMSDYDDDDDGGDDEHVVVITAAQARSSLQELSAISDKIYNIGYVKSDLRGLVPRVVRTIASREKGATRPTVSMHDFSVLCVNPVSASRTVGHATVFAMPDIIPHEFEVFAESFLMRENTDPCVRMVGSVHRYADSIGVVIGGLQKEGVPHADKSDTLSSVERVAQILDGIDRPAFRNGVLGLHPYKSEQWLRIAKKDNVTKHVGRGTMPMDEEEERGA